MKYFVLGAVWVPLTIPALAQEKVLPPVVVTAEQPSSATLESIDAARERLRTVPGGANVVDAEQYREGRVSTLSDALQFSPGVFAVSRFGAEEARLSIRGSGLQRTFHMRGIQLLQDGVPLNLADGSADFQAVEPLAASHIEILRGANALHFGSATLGGAVNFISPSGLTQPPFSARVEAGSFGYKRGQIAAGGKTADLDWFIAGAQYFQKGFRRHSRQETQRLSGNLGWKISQDMETRFFFNAVNTNSELPGALTRAELRVDPRQAAPDALSGDQHRDFDLFRLSNRTAFRLDALQRIELGGFISTKSLFHPIFQVLQQDSNDIGLFARYVGEGNLFGRANQLIIGTELSHGRLDDDRFRNAGGEPAERTGQSEQRSRNLSVYIENRHYLVPSTAFVVGAQAIQATRRLDDAFLSNGDNSVDRTYRRVSPKLGILHDLTERVQLYGNLSGSFEPPTFGELAGGPNVSPVAAQRAKSAEIGTRGNLRAQWGTVQWDLSLYRTHLKGELLALNDAAGNPLGTTNANRTVHQGIEAGLEAHVAQHWTLRATYQRNDFRFDDDAVFRNNRLAGIPLHFLAAEVLYRAANGLYFGPSLRAASETIVDHANSLEAPGYGLLGFKVGQQVTPRLSWFVDARNLADKHYVATTGVIADARGADSRQFYPGDERSVFAGIELRY